MSGLRPTASASSLASIASPSPGSFALPSNTHSSPLTYPPQQPSSPTSSSASFSKHSHYRRQGARDSSRRSESKTPSPPSSVVEIPSIQTQSPPSPHNHRPNRTSNSPITNQFLMLSGERPPSPLTLTSALAPPSVIPMTAAGISASGSVAKSTSSRRSPAASLKLSMLPSASASMVQPPTSAAAATATASQMSATSTYIHHHQASYSHSLSAQHKLQLHQKEIISQATRAAGIPPHLLSTGPMSPRLIPLGSPGPVTPLTLEDNPGGFFPSHAGALEHPQLSQQLAIVSSGGVMQS